MSKYYPTATDTQWALEMLGRLKEGAILAYPDTLLQYQVSHWRRTLTLVNPEQIIMDFSSFVVHQRTVEVFKQCGYTVEEGQYAA